jgi:hypothetical protein
MCGVPFALVKATGAREPMTCRIDRLSTEHGLVLYISGRIGAEDMEVVRTALDEHRVLAIELAAVELIHGDAVKLLAQTEAEGIELRNCPAYIRAWITKERESSL